jgi:hypothetical protein
MPELTENEKYLLSIYKPYKQLLREDELSLATPEEKQRMQELAERSMARATGLDVPEKTPERSLVQKKPISFFPYQTSELIQYNHSAHRNHRNHNNHSNHNNHVKNMKTTIELSKETRDKLKNLGRKGDTYEDIILRLLEKKNVDL